MGVLCGDESLDESIGALGVEREGVTQRSQLGAFLDKCLLQPVSSCVEVLLTESEGDKKLHSRLITYTQQKS